MPPRSRTSNIPPPKLPWDLPGADLPDSQTETKKWLAATDELCKQRFDLSQPLPYDHHRGQTDAQFAGTMNEDVLQEIIGARRLTCAAQLQLSRTITAMFTELDFEEKWLALRENGQEKYLLRAFKTHEFGPGEGFAAHGPEKLNCPEVCRDELMKDGGRGYLNLLKTFLLNNNDEQPTQPFLIPNARFDAIIGWGDDENSPNLKAWLSLRRLLRTRYIASFCGIVIAEYRGQRTTKIEFAHEHTKTKEVLAGIKPIVDSVVGESDCKRWVKKQTAHRKEMKLFCDNCLKIEDKKDGKMPICVKCKAIGREVRYCSKECQRAAWKNHKRECGKNFDLDSVFRDVSPLDRGNTIPTRVDIPPTAPGYRRTPDLLRLIGFLNEFTQQDYVIVLPSPDPHDPELESISVDELRGATTFIIMRNRAMCSGDESALFYVYRVLQNFNSLPGAEAIMQAQLKREYGQPFGRMLKALESGTPPAPPEVSPQDVDTAICFLKQLGRFQEELEDYVPGTEGKKTVQVGMQVGPKKDLTVVIQWPEDAMSPLVSVLPLGPGQPKKHPWKGQEPVGPNHISSLPPPRKDYERPAALQKQIKVLQENPTADYILWGNQDAPTIPHAVKFEHPMEAVVFLGYRRRLFMRGGFDLDALVYIIMTLEPAIRRRKFSKETLYAQLRKEYGHGYVDWAVDSIRGKKYHRRDGKQFLVGEIPASTEDFADILQQLKAIDRFALLRHLKS